MTLLQALLAEIAAFQPPLPLIAEAVSFQENPPPYQKAMEMAPRPHTCPDLDPSPTLQPTPPHDPPSSPHTQGGEYLRGPAPWPELSPPKSITCSPLPVALQNNLFQGKPRLDMQIPGPNWISEVIQNTHIDISQMRN